MKYDEARKIVEDTVKDVLDEDVEIQDDSKLIGEKALLDSMKLVEVCLALEDIADDHDFEFDWRSDSTMSRSRSMFRTVSSLAEELAKQSGDK